MDTVDRFERLKRKLGAIETANVVGADDIFEAISLLLSDIDAMHDNGGIDTYEVKHEDVFVTSLLKTINAAMKSYEKNVGCLNGISERRQKSYDIALAKIRAADQELSPLLPRIEELKKTESDLEAKLSRIVELKAVASKLEKSIQHLEAEIAKLDSVSVEELQDRKTQLSKEKDEKQAELESLRAYIDSLTREIDTLKKDIEEKRTVQKRNAEEQAQLEAEDNEISKQLSDYLIWKSIFVSEQQKRLSQMAEMQNQLTAVRNAWSTVSRRPDLPDMLKEVGELQAFNPTLTNFEDIKKWFDEMQTGIQICIDVFTDTYKALLSVIAPNKENE